MTCGSSPPACRMQWAKSATWPISQPNDALSFWSIAIAGKMKKPACACVPPCKLAGSRLLPIKRLNRQRKDGVVSLLSVQFEPGEAPAGLMRLIFSGGGEIRLEVEACEAILEDISAPWAASSQPAHEDDTRRKEA